MERDTLRKLFDRMDRAAIVRCGSAMPADHCLSLATAWRLAIEVLKATPFDELPAAIWQMEQDLESITREGVDRFAAEHGGIRSALQEMMRRVKEDGPGGDGDSFEFRPHRGGHRS